MQQFKNVQGDTVYVGTTNGGIWETQNALLADNSPNPNPTWFTTTDGQSSLSISSLSFDPSSDGQTIVAGIGRMSNDFRQGGPLDGILRTTNGGATWQQLNGNGTLNGKNIVAVAERGSTILVAVNDVNDTLAANQAYSEAGIYRSTDAGVTFTQISNGTGGSTGLPAGITYDLVGDPTNSNVFYTAVIGNPTSAQTGGIYRSTNSGAAWTKISSTAVDLDLPTATTHNVQLSVGYAGELYVGIVNPLNATTDYLANVWCSTNPTSTSGVTWTLMATPQTIDGGKMNYLTMADVPAQDPGGTADALQTLPSGKNSIGFSMVADPFEANVVYVGGGTQPAPLSASSIGATGYDGRLFCVTLTQSTPLTNNFTLSNTAPHAGSRVMVFDGDYLLEGDDGGVYAETTNQETATGLNTANGDWISLNGNGLESTELYAAAYDSISNVLVGSAQDVNVSAQTAAGSPTWQDVGTAPSPASPVTGVAEGGAVAVDDISQASSGDSYRYTSSQYLDNFQQQTVNANNVVVGTTSPGLAVNGQTFYTLNGGEGQLVTPVVVNSINGNIVIGGNDAVFESINGGANLTDLNAAGGANAMVYGGYQGITPEASVLWVATNSGVFLRPATGGPLNQLRLPRCGGPFHHGRFDRLDQGLGRRRQQPDLVHRQSGQHLEQRDSDEQRRLFPPRAPHSALHFRQGRRRPVAPGRSLLVGGSQGVYFTQFSLTNPPSSTASWYKLSSGLTAAAVTGLTYNAANDLLVAATLGRGAWELSSVRENIFGVPQAVTVDSNDGTQIYNGSLLSGVTLATTPNELDITFNKNASLNPATLPSPQNPDSGILVVYAGDNGKFYDLGNGSFNTSDTDDQILTPGYVGLSQTNPDEVIFRFANDLPAGNYEVILVGQENYIAANRKAVGPLRNMAGIDFGVNNVAGQNLVLNFALNLPPQVVAVNPQAVVSQQDFQVKNAPTIGGQLTLSTVAVPSARATPVNVSTTFQFNADYLQFNATTNPAPNDTVTIEGLSAAIGYLQTTVPAIANTFTFVTAAPTSPNEVQIGATVADTVSNLVAAINSPATPFGVFASAVGDNVYLNGYTVAPTTTGLVQPNFNGQGVPLGVVAVQALPGDTPAVVAANLCNAINFACAAGLTATVPATSATTVAVDASGVVGLCQYDGDHASRRFAAADAVAGHR